MEPAESEDFGLKRSVGRRSAAYTVPVVKNENAATSRHQRTRLPIKF